MVERLRGRAGQRQRQRRLDAEPLCRSCRAKGVVVPSVCVYLNTKGRRQVTLDIAVTALCAVVAALWTQAHSLDLLPAAISAMTIAAIGYGLIGMAKSQFVTALREAAGTFLRGIAATPAPMVETDDTAIDRLSSELDKVN